MKGYVMRASWHSSFGYVLIAGGALAACTNHYDTGDTPSKPTPAASESVPQPSATPPRPLEACNALDDNGDGIVDEVSACKAACSTDGIAKLAASLRLPRLGDITVPNGNAETPELLAIQQVPDFCFGELPRSTCDDVTVGCGEVLDVDHRGIAARTLRIAPGGVVRFKANALLDIKSEILICPGAVIQSGTGLALNGNGVDGFNVELRAARLLLLGSIETRGGWVSASSTHRPGNSGDVRIEVERLLFAGTIDAQGRPIDKAYRAGEAGFVGIQATKESFFSGSVLSGNAAFTVPVCCHG